MGCGFKPQCVLVAILVQTVIIVQSFRSDNSEVTLLKSHSSREIQHGPVAAAFPLGKWSELPTTDIPLDCIATVKRTKSDNLLMPYGQDICPINGHL